LSVSDVRILFDEFDNIILQVTEMVFFDLQLSSLESRDIWGINRDVGSSSCVGIDL